MKLKFDFDGFEPPRLTEKKLVDIVNARQLANRTLILSIASLLTDICLALLAFSLAPYSLEAGLACLALLGASLIGSGIIAVVFAKRYPTSLRSILEA